MRPLFLHSMKQRMDRMNRYRQNAAADAADPPLSLPGMLLALAIVAVLAVLAIAQWPDDRATARDTAAQAAIDYARSLVPLTVQQAYEKGLADAMAARPPNGVAALAACGWYPLGQQGRQP